MSRDFDSRPRTRKENGRLSKSKATTKRFCIVFAVVAGWLLAAPAEAQQAYEGQISGTYNGWTGETIYKLMDGHIIQQSEYHYHYHYAYAPKVIIYESVGGYKIHVEEDDDDRDVGIRILK
jgi:hypothetical protein